MYIQILLLPPKNISVNINFTRKKVSTRILLKLLDDVQAVNGNTKTAKSKNTFLRHSMATTSRTPRKNLSLFTKTCLWLKWYIRYKTLGRFLGNTWTKRRNKFLLESVGKLYRYKWPRMWFLFLIPCLLEKLWTKKI